MTRTPVYIAPSGTIPDLLRTGSVVRVRRWDASTVVAHILTRSAQLATGDIVPLRDLTLDLRDPTSRAHAAWWLHGQDWDAVKAAVREHVGAGDAIGVLGAWMSGAECSEAMIAALCRVVRQVAGLEVPRG